MFIILVKNMFFEVNRKLCFVFVKFFSCNSEENSFKLINRKKILSNLTPRNISIMELITSEQRFVDDLKNILKVISGNISKIRIDFIHFLDLYNTNVG